MTNESKLYRVGFLLSVLILLSNDFYLKYEYHNYLTGKISDFAGLFAFPYFFSCWYSKKTKFIYLFAALFFVFWKSSFSQFLFDYSHHLGIYINRVVDYSDLIALSILPVSYIYFKRDNFSKILSINSLRPLVLVVSCFSFIATTLPKHTKDYNFKSDVVVNLSSSVQQVKEQINLISSDNERLKYYYWLEIPEKNGMIKTKVQLHEKSDTITEIQLDSILDYSIEGTGFIFFTGYNDDAIKYFDNLSQKDIENIFEEEINFDSQN